MARTPDTNFTNFIVRAVRTTPLTTVELYNLAKTRGLALTKSRTRDASRPNFYAWQHQIRRDQFKLASKGVIRRTVNGTWTVTSPTAANNFLTA